MIENTISQMIDVIEKLHKAIQDDIEDIKLANHENLLDRNEIKQQYMKDIVEFKSKLNSQLVALMKEGVDVNIYRDKVDNLESKLRELYKLNGKLASIVLPVKQMYKDIVDELTSQSGGNIFEIKA